MLAARRAGRAPLAALQRFIVAHLGDPEAIVVLDETAELKKGTATVGVARQHAGITGQVENCQTVVFAAYVTARAHVLSDFRLYLPKAWCAGQARREKAPVSAVAAMIPGTAWETRSCGRGCKGHRDYEWAWAGTALPRHWVLIRRSLSNPKDLAFYFCHAPEGRPVSLAVLIRVAGKDGRWKNASSREKARSASTSTKSGPGSPSTGTPCCPCAPTPLLAIAAARPAPHGPDADSALAGQPAVWHETGKLPATVDDDPPGSEPGLVKVSAPEARLARLATQPMTTAARQLGYAWSRWRRHHQARARWRHYHAQLKAAQAT